MQLPTSSNSVDWDLYTFGRQHLLRKQLKISILTMESASPTREQMLTNTLDKAWHLLVNAHHQNGKSKQRIQELHTLVWAMMLTQHAIARRWRSNMINAVRNLRPYQIQAMWSIILHADRRSSISKIYLNSKVATTSPRDDWKPFGCLTFYFTNQLQSNRPFHKWSQWSSRSGLLKMEFCTAGDE